MIGNFSAWFHKLISWPICLCGRSRESRHSRGGLESAEDFLAADHRRFFTELNGSHHGHVLQAFAEGVPQRILAFCQNFGHGCFKESFQAAFFDGGHDGNLLKRSLPVNRGDKGPTSRRELDYYT